MTVIMDSSDVEKLRAMEAENNHPKNIGKKGAPRHLEVSEHSYSFHSGKKDEPK